MNVSILIDLDGFSIELCTSSILTAIRKGGQNWPLRWEAQVVTEIMAAAADQRRRPLLWVGAVPDTAGFVAPPPSMLYV
eukprot:scaffold1886_cov38-Phaeocystis_antarctica.AAC.2